MDESGPRRPEEAPGSTESTPESADAGADPRRGVPGPSIGVMVAAFATLAAVLIAGAVTMGIRLAGDYSGDGTRSGPITTMVATPVDRPDRTTGRSRVSGPMNNPTAQRRSSAACEPREADADRGTPSRDCPSPNPRTSATDTSADRPSPRPSASPSPSPRPSPEPSATPSALPTNPEQPTSPSSSSSPSTSATPTFEETTTTTPAASPTAVADADELR